MSFDMRKGLAAAAVAIALSGCAAGASASSGTDGRGESSQATHATVETTLQSYVDKIRPSAEAEAARYADVYSAVSMEAEGTGTLVYRYTFRSAVKAVQARPGILSMQDTLETFAEEHIFPDMSAAGIDDPSAKWIYHNPDGSVLATVQVEG